MPSTKDSPAPPGRPLALDDAREILARLRQLRGRHGRVALWTGIAMMIAALSVWLVSETVTDFLSNLPWVVRLVFLVLTVVRSPDETWITGGQGSLSPLYRPPNRVLLY